MYSCNICGETYEDELLGLAHWELYHNRQPINEECSLPNARASVIHYAPATNATNEVEEEAVSVNQLEGLAVPLTIQILSEALPNSVVRHFIIKNNNDLDLDTFFRDVKDLVVDCLSKELNRLHFIKFGLVLETTFVNMENEIDTRGFVTRNRSIMLTSDIEAIIEECLQELILKITEHEGRGSGWSLFSIKSIDIRVHKHGYGDRGSSYIKLPNKILYTKACINVQNQDNECFRYAMLSKFLQDDRKAYLPTRRYEDFNNKYNFNGISYPVSIKDIKYFERHNLGVSVNVFALDGSLNVYPLKVVSMQLRDHTDLLLLKDGDVSHYVYIRNFMKLVVRQLTKRRHPITVCKRCFCFTNLAENRGGLHWLIEHIRLCSQKTAVKIQLPAPGRNQLRFDKVYNQYRIPIVVYADFESSLIPVPPDPSMVSNNKYQKHEPHSYCLLLKSTLSEEHLQYYGLTMKPQLYRGENVAKIFLDNLYDIARKVYELYSYIVPMKELDDLQILSHMLSDVCYLCNSSFTESNLKVRDHDHLTGLYRGPACNACNINYKLPNFIPVVIHNLSGYDAHFIIPELGRDKGCIDVLATTTEKFISFSKKVDKKIKLRFIDSFRFMPSSLMTLSSNLNRNDLVETKKLVPNDKFDLVVRKGVFPYDYIDSITRLSETSLPPPECFYNKLNETSIEAEDYEHACKVWNELNMNTLGEYSDFYVTLDVTLLCDVMEEFRNTCMRAYDLDPLHSYTSAGLAWHAMLKDTKCNLELLTDINMVLMVESGIRGGLTQSVTRHVKANNKYLPNYNENEESVYIGYFDANNLYGWAMSMPLPFGDFKWVNPDSLGDILQIPQNSDTGFFLECDIEYPDFLHDHHYDLPLLAKTEIPPEGKYPKLMMTLHNKTKYVAHYWVIQQAVQFGLRIVKVHRALKFRQSCWLKPYIESNTIRRAASTSAFQKDFFKLMNNAIFGKTLENKRKHKNVKLVTDSKKLEKLVKKPNFNTSIIINENLVLVCMDKTTITMDRPLYVGMSILDISKVHMYDFHYNKMVKHYGRDRIGISYMDTDAFVYWIKTLDMYEDLKTFRYRNDFDFSDYPNNHPTYDNGINKKVVGKFKDEANGVPLEEIVALMSKLYSLKLLADRSEVEENGVVKKAKGIKKYVCRSR